MAARQFRTTWLAHPSRRLCLVRAGARVLSRYASLGHGLPENLRGRTWNVLVALFDCKDEPHLPSGAADVAALRKNWSDWLLDGAPWNSTTVSIRSYYRGFPFTVPDHPTTRHYRNSPSGRQKEGLVSAHSERSDRHQRAVRQTGTLDGERNEEFRPHDTADDPCAGVDCDGGERMSQPSDREERQTTCWCSTQQLYGEMYAGSLRTEGHRQRWTTARRRRKDELHEEVPKRSIAPQRAVQTPRHLMGRCRYWARISWRRPPAGRGDRH
jgi:hypothetical protein